MSTIAPAHLLQWWAYASNASVGARFVIARTFARLLQRLERWASDEPRNAQELLALARSLERTQPALAAELRCIASHRPDGGE